MRERERMHKLHGLTQHLRLGMCSQPAKPPKPTRPDPPAGLGQFLGLGGLAWVIKFQTHQTQPDPPIYIFFIYIYIYI